MKEKAFKIAIKIMTAILIIIILAFLAWIEVTYLII